MARELSLLDQVQVANPCSASWEAMRGDDRVRSCGACRKSVHNLSGMSRAEAERFVRASAGRACIRYERREDGTTITRRSGAALFVGRVAAAVALVVASMTMGAGCRAENGILRGSRLRQAPAIGRLLEWIDPSPPCPPVAGAMVPLPLPPRTTTRMGR